MGGAIMSFPKKRLRNYRVSWLRDGGMTTLDATATFRATSDKEALEKVRDVTGNEGTFELEQFRKIKKR